MGLVRHYAGNFARGCLPTPVFRGLQRARATWKTWRHNAGIQRLLRQHGTFTPQMLHDELLQHGVRAGCVLLVHSSFDAFANFQGNANDVLDVLLDLVGPGGTLVMPSQPMPTVSKFDSRRSPASTGMLCELFRRTDGAVRSLHAGQSVCARGPLANELTREHHLDELGCGRLSPYAKLAQFDSQILGLGLPPLYTTFLHVVEDLDLERYPRQIYSGERHTCRVVDAKGDEFSFEFPRRNDRILSTMNLNRLAKHLSPQSSTPFDVHGVPCFVCHPSTLLAELKDLAKNGILLYG